jgi:glycosyltransferase involved in cell wall biosynthesis
MVAAADICLGIFGTTRKTQMVIPNKVYQAATVGRAVISADTPAAREVFTHGETAWLCPAGNPQALADAIRRLAGDVALRTRLGAQAARLMREQFSLAARGGRLAAILAGAMERA